MEKYRINLDNIPSKKDKDYSSKTILFVGNDYYRKGADVLVKAIPLIRKKFPECKVLIVGEQGDRFNEDLTCVGLIQVAYLK
jgi:glycosyltransferase involved in cell wall biosynthesis